MHIPRFVIAGLSGGSGKTMLSLGLARALARRGLAVRAFKKGPDYIDAAWLALASGAPQGNLDPFFLEPEALKTQFFRAVAGCGCAVIEGNRGLFDGLDLSGSCSTAQLARCLGAPVVLVVDCTKMTRTAGALVKGCLDFEEGVRIGGVICNRTGTERHASLVRRAVEDLAGVPVLGVLPRREDMALAERHMGLAGADEYAQAKARLDGLADFVGEHVDLDAVYALASTAPGMDQPGGAVPAAPPTPEMVASFAYNTGQPSTPGAPLIGYVRDAALWFYYEENLAALRAAGAELVALSLLDDTPWPDLDGLYLGGGMPELHAGALAANVGKRALVASLCRSGLPVYAECGGLMYLAQHLLLEGKRYPMAGVLPADVEFCARPQGLGYVEAAVALPNPFHPVGALIRGHEFHFSRYLPRPAGGGGEPQALLHLARGRGLGGQGGGVARDGVLLGNTFAAYTHIYAPAVPHWAVAFAAQARRWRR